MKKLNNLRPRQSYKDACGFFHMAPTQKQQASTCEAFPHISPLFFYKGGMTKKTFHKKLESLFATSSCLALETLHWKVLRSCSLQHLLS